MDAHVGRHLFDKVIGPKGILNNKTRLLVTHNVSVLPFVDQIIVLKNGTIAEMGSFDELVANKGEFAEFVAEYIVEQSDEDIFHEDIELMEGIAEKVRPLIERSLSYTESMVSDTASERSRRPSLFRSISRMKDKSSDKSGTKESQPKPRTKKMGRLIEQEMSETGSVKLDVYKRYIQTMGYLLCVAILISFIASNGAQVASSLWLSEWSNDALDPNKTGDTALRNMRLGVYGAFGTVEAFFSLIASIALNLACIKAAKIMHNKMIMRIMRAPMSFFGQFNCN